jgi:hypothetical protein
MKLKSLPRGMPMTLKTRLLPMLLIVSACATPSGPIPDFCAAYRAVPTLSCGTETQQLAVDQNNAVYMELCR